MAFTFRRFVVALALLAVLPSAGRAAPLAISAVFLNSNLTYGGASFEHAGYDLSNLSIHGVDTGFDFVGTEFLATGGSLVAATPNGDSNIAWPHTLYRYEGGTFTIDFWSNSQQVGTFTAPIISLEIVSSEPPDPVGSGGSGGSVLATYVLDFGSFDSGMASLFGIPMSTGKSSYAFSSMYLLFDSPELVAEDGGFALDVDAAPVPEPALSLLCGLGLAAAVRARRRRV